MKLYSDNGNQPGSELANLGTSGTSTGDWTEETVSFDGGGYLLSPSTKYWLVASSTNPDCDLGWVNQGAPAPTGIFTSLGAASGSGTNWWVGGSVWIDISAGTAPAAPVPAAAPAQLDVFNPGDDRINDHAVDRSAPVAVYCQSYGIQVYDVDGITGKGSLLPVISLSNEEVDAMGVPTDAPLLLAQAGDTTLWRLPTGEFQVNAYYDMEWKPWAFVWNDCPMTSGYHLEN
jgi:hypothetical protein